MKKSDLRDGMIVTYRDGQMRVVANGNLMYGSDNSQLGRRNYDACYDDNLLDLTGSSNLDIIEVEVPHTVWTRDERTPEQKEAEAIRKEMDKLSIRLKELE